MSEKQAMLSPGEVERLRVAITALTYSTPYRSPEAEKRHQDSINFLQELIKRHAPEPLGEIPF